MLILGKSDVGRVRDVNQDNYSCCVCCDSVGWAVVCDGMGGANGGNIASEIAINSIKEQFERNISSNTTPNSIKMIMTSAVAAANSLIYSKAQKNKELEGMGTTLVCVVVKDRIAYIMHAGDSRLYRVRNGEAERITKDHSLVQMLVDSGEITSAEATTHPKKNYITKALGVYPEIECEYNEIECGEYDTIVLCSDGLTNYISDEQLGAITEQTAIIQLPERFVETANVLGGADNITAVVLSQF